MSNVDADLVIDAPPDDTITSMQFSPSSANHLLVSSWDSEVRLYDLENNTVKSALRHRAAVFSSTFDPNHTELGYSGGLDSWVRRWNFDTEEPTVLGMHERAVTGVIYSNETSQLITGSWDYTVKLWDPRRGNPKSLLSTHTQPERVLSMSLVNHKLVVATAGRRVLSYDIREMNGPLDERGVGLKFNTSSVACMLGGEGFAAGSVEGRVSIEYFDKSPEVQKEKYAFKCHRMTIPEGDLVTPIHALAFHPQYGTLATGGSDGGVSLWDHRARKRIKMHPRLPTSISALAFSHDGTRIAIAASNTQDASGHDQRKELASRDIDPNHVSITVKSVGSEYKRKGQA